MRDQLIQRHGIKATLMGGFQNHLRRTSCLERLLPSKHAKAPLIAGLQPWKLVPGDGRAQVIAFGLGESQKFLGHDGADRVRAGVHHASVAAAISEKTGHGIFAAGLQRLPKYVVLWFL